MHSKEFIIEVLRAVSWPLATIIALLLVRRPLISLLSSASKLKYGDLEMAFEKQVAEVKVVASQLPASHGLSSEEREALERSVMTSPQNTVIEAWRRLENVIIEF